MKIVALIFSVFVVGCGTAPTRFVTHTSPEHIDETSTDLVVTGAQDAFDRAFAERYDPKPVAEPREVVVVKRKAQGRKLPKAKRATVTRVAVQPPVVEEEVTEVAPPPQRRVAPPESTVPCYLHAPPAVPRGDVMEFRNETQNHVGFRVNGEFVTVVGAIPQPNTRALPYGVALTPSLLPPGTRCYFAMRTAGGSHHIDSVLFRLDPYSGRPQGMGKASDYVTVAYPRSRTYVYAFKNYLY
jgi:hypothetical protein